ncbi:GGDEF domain-containing protein [Deinococcus roseus]|uniref:GGDEF domain-containing protein n=1 Tax=Deinococcus roseus TaxID=392414 RepID=A0ABQ2CXC0_9DEIO|nr:GGDEF domain-containing protein [Deinococcus roseus]GGJ28773.1 hypothetical protein GCM10008938_13580 [Deinococcus roseus]
MASLDGLIDHNAKLIWASALLKKHLPHQDLQGTRVQVPEAFQPGEPVMLAFHAAEQHRELMLTLVHIPGGLLGCAITQLPPRSNRLPWEQHQRMLALQEAAYRDPLTGLLNRRAFEEHLEHHVQSPGQFSLIMVDLDGLKHMNDTHGHEAGDAFLQTFASVLQEQLRTSDTPFRIGGDEFAVIMQDLEASQIHIVEKRLEGVRAVVRERMYPECDFSAGVAFFPQESPHDPKLLLHLADERMYENKNAKKHPTVPHARLVNAVNRRAVFQSQQATLDLLGSGQLPDVHYWQSMLEYAIQMVPSAQAGSLNLWEESGFVRVAQLGFDDQILGLSFTQQAQQVWYGESAEDWRKGSPRIFRGAELISQKSREAADLVGHPVDRYASAGRIREIVCNITAPICHDGQVYGHLSLDNFAGPRAFNEESRLAALEIVRQCATVCRLLNLQSCK